MFELLLQADKAIAGGFLDQAEKTYWQLIELDPSNAIAVAGLARISMERGDERMARTFAERALGIDPDSILARRLIDSIERGTAGESDDDPPAIPLLAAERLEALSRRRGKDAGPTADSPESPEVAGTGPNKATAAVAPAATSRKDRGKTRPDQIGALPAEPLRERRQAGRLAAAAAAAAAAAREPVRPRHEPHHAMPVGRFRFDPGELKAPSADEFAAAEMAAAVAAVDELDDTAPQEAAAAPQEAAAEPRADEFGDLLGTIDATAADDSVALRLAMLGGEVDLDAAERAAELEAESDNEVADDMFEAAEAVASGFLPHQPPVFLPRMTASEAAESQWPSLTTPSEFENADAAEAEAAATALREVAGSGAGLPQAQQDDRAHVRPRFESLGDQDPTEEEAEAQALREAMAIVLAGDGETADGVRVADIPQAPETAAETEPAAEHELGPECDPEPESESESESATAGDTADPNPEPTSTEPEPTPERRKGGLFHRIRGN
jgi:tetratricopeptide (TPR) repeat protein